MSEQTYTESGNLPRTGVASLDEINLVDHLPAVARRWKFIALRTFIVVIVAGIGSLAVKNRYTAETVIMPPGSSSINASLAGQLGGSSTLASAAGASLGLKNPGDLYVSLLRSRRVEDSVVQRFKLVARYGQKETSLARLRFERNTKVELGVKDGLITIDVTDPDPNMAAQLANGYVEEFQKFSADFAATEASQRRRFFEQQLRDANNDLMIAEETLKGTEQSNGVVQIDSQTRSLVETAASLRAQIVAKEVQLQGMRSYATNDNPDLLGTKSQIAELQSQLAQLTGDNQSVVSGLILPKSKMSTARMEYLHTYRDVKYYETVSDIVARQFEIAKLDEARQGAITQVVDHATVPDKPTYPKRGLTVLIAAVTSFLAICAWCIYTEVNDKSGLSTQTGAQVQQRSE